MAAPSSSIAVKSPPLSKRADLLLKIAIAVISSLFFLGLLEGLAYLWERDQANGLYAWELVASRRMVWQQHTEPGAGYTLMEPHSRYEWQNIPVEINSRGLRGSEIAYEKPPNTFRILNVGDSIAMGWGVREEETYSRQLEQLLNQQATGNIHYEVINAGVPGWNLENELAYLQAEGLKYQPDLILLDLTIVNDIYGKSALAAHKRPAVIEWLRANTYFWPFLTVQLRWIEAQANGQERIDVIDPPTKPDSYFPLEPEAKRWVQVWEQISAMNRLAKENNADFRLILFPLEFQVLDESYTTLPQELLTAEATQDNIPVLDLLPTFRQACQDKPGGSCQLEDRYLFADVWMHPSAYGHTLTAIEVQAFLAGILE